MLGRTKSLATLALALTLPLASCDTGTDAEFGEVSLLLTDANEGEITQAWVAFTDIYLQGSPGESDPENGRHYLLEDDYQEHELTSLAGSVADLVWAVPVPTGSYGQLRVVIEDACIVVDEETVYSSSPEYTKCGEPTGVLNLTSGGTSGWKVLLNGLQVEGSHTILLDFVVDESYFKATSGPADRYNLHPVIKGAEVALSGDFAISLSDPDALLPAGRTLDEFSVLMEPAVGDDETVAFVLDGDLGVASFQYELPGMAYLFTLVPPADLAVTVTPASPTGLELDSGGLGTVDWVITEVAPVP